jgi:REP element-mobilizing transposase RayT
VFADGGIYHVYCRVGHGEPIFRDDAEAGALVETIESIRRRDELTIFAWCVMSNHYHLAMRTARVPLWRSMRLVQGRFSKGYNRRHEVYGPLWQGRYKASLVQGEAYLRQVVAYIHLNPVAAGVVTDPVLHRWSGHHEILKGVGGDGLVDVDEALLLFGESREGALRAYVSALPGMARTRLPGRDPESLPWWRSRALDDVLKPREGPRLDALGASSEPETTVLSADEFVVAAAKALDVGVPQLIGPRTGRELTQLREMLALLAVERYRIRVKDLAQSLARNPSVVSRWVSAAGDRRTSEEGFRTRLEDLAANIRGQTAPQRGRSERSEFVSGVDGGFID